MKDWQPYSQKVSFLVPKPSHQRFQNNSKPVCFPTLAIIPNHRSGKDVGDATIENRDAFEPDTCGANIGAVLFDHHREKLGSCSLCC